MLGLHGQTLPVFCFVDVSRNPVWHEIVRQPFFYVKVGVGAPGGAGGRRGHWVEPSPPNVNQRDHTTGDLI